MLPGSDEPIARPTVTTRPPASWYPGRMQKTDWTDVAIAVACLLMLALLAVAVQCDLIPLE